MFPPLPRLVVALSLALSLFISSAALAENEGKEDLDKATELRISAQGLQDINQVIELLDSAMEKGLDAENSDFAEQMLVGALMQRASAISRAVIDKGIDQLRQDRRWLELRQLALNDLQRATTLDPTQYDAYMLIGRLQTFPLGDPSAARTALTEVVEAPEGEIPPTERAAAHALRGSTQTSDDKRLADFDRAIELDPEETEFRLLRARHYYAEREYDKALEDIDAALELDPESFVVHELKALVHLAQDNPEKALESFNRASELSPDAITPYQYRGEVFRQLGDLDKAIEQLNEAIELAPENFLSLLIRSELHLLAGEAEKALEDVDAALEIQPSFLRSHLLKIRVLDELGRKDEALAQLEKLAAAMPQQTEVQLQLAAYYIDSQRPSKALAALNRILQQDPDHQLALRLRGDTYLTVGKHAEALEDFKKALEESPEDPGILNNYAWTLATSPEDDLRDGEKAIELATKACELTDFKAPHILSTLAASYAETGDFDKAIEWAQKAVDLGGDDHDGQLQRELASYQEKKPWRERQEVTEEPESDQQEVTATPATTPAPARTIDF